MSLQEILGVPKPSDPLEKMISEANPPVPPTEVKETESTPPAEENKPTEEQNVPFHEHPRFKELVEEKNTYKQSVDDLSSKIAEMEEKFGKLTQTAPNTTNLPPEFVELFGSQDASVYEKFKKLTQGNSPSSSLTQEDVVRILEERENQRQKESEEFENAKAEAITEMENKVSELSQKYGFNKGKFRDWFSKDPKIKVLKHDGGQILDWEYDWETAAVAYAAQNPSKSRESIVPQSNNAEISPTSTAKTLEELAKSGW